MTIKAITKYVTDDGAEHSSVEMANQHLANKKLVRSLASMCDMEENKAQDVLNYLAGNAQDVRAWLDLNDAMMNEAMKS